MKVGELVELSAYGKRVETIRRLRNDVGIVLSSCIHSAHVQWSRNGLGHVNRREIKKVRC